MTPGREIEQPKKALVVGGAGFIGHHLVQELVYRGFEVYVIDDKSTCSEENLKSISAILPEKNLKIANGLLVNIKGMDIVFNCAAQPRMQWVKEQPIRTITANVMLVAQLAVQAKIHGIPLVHCSSSSVYGHNHNHEDDGIFLWEEGGIPEDEEMSPTNSYGLQKALAESTIQDMSPNAVMLRFFNVYGAGQPDSSPYTGVITKFLKQKREGKKLTIFGDGSQERDFTYVKDVVDAMIRSYEFLRGHQGYPTKNTGVHVYNIASSNPCSVKDIAFAVGGDIEYLENRPGDVERTKGNIEKAREDLGWSPSDMTPIKYIKSL